MLGFLETSRVGPLKFCWLWKHLEIFCKIFLSVNKVQNTYTLSCNLIRIVVCSKNLSNLHCAYINVIHFLVLNPIANACNGFIFVFIDICLMFLHLVNFVPTLLDHILWNHDPRFIKAIDNFHPIIF
jgi:hypothetical protein